MIKQYCLILFLPFISCQSQVVEESDVNKFIEENQKEIEPDAIENYYKAHAEHLLPSKSNGSVSNGSLENGKLIPFSGNNFQYFDTTSYLSDRAFVNDKLERTVVESYKELENSTPGRKFRIMECSHKEGGQLYPHRTHQNGLSVDFMMPLVKDGKPYYELDDLGANHYFMDFNDDGTYKKKPIGFDPALSQEGYVSIDFDLVAKHLLVLEKYARANGLKISKLIIKLEFKEALYAFSHGQKLMNSGIYVAQNLSPLINSLHDDHYHIDFEIMK